MSTDAGIGVGVGAGVGVRSSTFRRFGSAFSDSSSSSLLCLRLVGDDDEDTDDDDESVPGAEAEDAALGVGVRGRGSVVVIVVVVGSGAGVGGVGEDADEGVLSSSTTIGGGVGAVDIFLVDAAAAPHVHLSMNCPHQTISTNSTPTTKHDFLPESIPQVFARGARAPSSPLDNLPYLYKTFSQRHPHTSTKTIFNAHCLSSFCEVRSACMACIRSACIRCKSSLSACFSRAECARSACTSANSFCTAPTAASHVCSRRSLAGWRTLNAAIDGGTAILC